MSTTKNISNQANDIKNEAKDTAHDIKNEMKDKAHDPKNEMKDRAYENKQNHHEVSWTEAAVEGVKEVYETTSHAISEGTEAVIEKVKEWTGFENHPHHPDYSKKEENKERSDRIQEYNEKLAHADESNDTKEQEAKMERENLEFRFE